MNSKETLQKVMNIIGLTQGAKAEEAELAVAPVVDETEKTQELAEPAPMEPQAPAEPAEEEKKDPIAELSAKVDALMAKLDILVAAAEKDVEEDVVEEKPAAMPMMSKAKEANLSAAKPFNGAPVEQQKVDAVVKIKTGDTLSRVLARLYN